MIFGEASDRKIKSWLTIPHKETHKDTQKDTQKENLQNMQE